jgi:hypothetical protein
MHESFDADKYNLSIYFFIFGKFLIFYVNSIEFLFNYCIVPKITQEIGLLGRTLYLVK